LWYICVVKEQEGCRRDGKEGEGGKEEEQSAQVCLDGWARGEDLDWAKSSDLGFFSVLYRSLMFSFSQ
jgi:hypothetical protein